MDNPNPELEDFLMANGFMLEVFMLQVSLELARSKEAPGDWARAFVTKLHERVDANEARTDDRRYPVHELARQGFDRLGSHLDQVLKLPS